MDLEHLTKHQVILLTLLVSLVTSIVTGIVTVSLMNQAPQGVTRTINQIVEHTVQTVVPATQGAAAATVTTEKTVVVKDDDLTAQSIAAVQKAIVRITAHGDDALVARGVIVDSAGTALTDSDALKSSGAKEFDAILSDGSRVPATVIAPATSSPIGMVTVAYGTSTAVTAIKMADVSKVALGQSVIRIGGKGADTVGTGVVAALPGKGSDIEASVTSATPGSILMTIFGELIGISTADSLTDGADFYTVPKAPEPDPKPVPKTQ
ncbi:MAG TPA: hypothetical protein VG984_02140 [Candidatus Paceibacterota bacterium]|nr:hypothetical protein [Candidatus Paceibacterota bacterium]